MAILRPRAIAAGLALAVALPLAACATPAAPAGLSPELVAEVVAQRRDALWDAYLGNAPIDRPEVEIVAYIPPDQLMGRYVACMHDSGYPEVHEYGDGISLGPAGGNDVNGYLALWVCTAQYPVHPALLGYLSTEQRGYLWDYWDTRTVPCLRALGQDVLELEDRDEFIADEGGYPSSQSPYALVDPTELGWDGIDAACPPLPEETFGAWHP